MKTKFISGIVISRDQIYITDFVSVDQREFLGDEQLDTRVRFGGKFTVAGGDEKKFAEELGALIEKYRI
jgi:hypothetical protein